MRTILASAVLAFAALPALAVAAGREVNIFTFEDSSCAAWTKSGKNKLLRAQYLFWIQGFVSGHNYASQSQQVKTGRFPALEALDHYLDAYCRDNPTRSFVGAAIALVEDLSEPVTPAKTAPAKAAPAKKAAPAAPSK